MPINILQVLSGRTGTLGPTFALLAASVIAVISGLAAALGGYLVVGMLAAVLIGLGLISNPRLHITLTLIVALVLTGSLEFFASFAQANWLSSVLAGSLIFTAFICWIGYRQARTRDLSMMAALTFGYLLTLFFASVVNGIPISQALVGIRNYVPYMGVALAIVWTRLDRATGQMLIRALIYIALLQVPVTLFQFFVVGPWRSSQRGAVGRADEAIAGTFGGNALGGTYTGEMACFLVMVIVLVLAMGRERVFGVKVAGGLCGILLIPILVAETKVALILIPLLISVAFWSDARRNPRFALLALLASIMLFLVVAATYYARHWGDPTVARQQLSYIFDPGFRSDPWHRGRIGTLVHWYESNVEYGDYYHVLIGHGVGSTVEGSVTIGQGSAVKKYGLGLDTHALSRLLWDGGVLALGFLSAIVMRTFLLARRLARRILAGPERAAATFCMSAALAMALMLPYQLSILGGSAMQFIFWFVVGYTEMLNRRWNLGLAKQIATSRNNPATAQE